MDQVTHGVWATTHCVGATANPVEATTNPVGANTDCVGQSCAKTVALVFAKYPQAGTVKTRMVPPLTPDQAAELHLASLAAVCEQLAMTTHCEGATKVLTVKLVVTPDDRVAHLLELIDPLASGPLAECGRPENSHLAPTATGRTAHRRRGRNSREAGRSISEAWPQGDGDLGQRLIRASARAFAGGAEVVLLLGADSPTLPARLLHEALASLMPSTAETSTQSSAVLGPCDDGGYYLLGLRRPLPTLFEGIQWGSRHVAEQTRRRASLAGIQLRELPPWYDLDRFEDLRQAQRDLKRLAVDSSPAMIALQRVIEASRRL